MNKLLIFLLLFSAFKSNAQLKKPVTWSYAGKKISATEAVIYIRATIDNGWHIYSSNQKDGGPKKTSFSFSGAGFSLVGKVLEPKPIIKYENVFDMDVLYFEKNVVFSQKIRLLAKQLVVKGKVEFMACTDKECLPPDEISFSIPIK